MSQLQETSPRAGASGVVSGGGGAGIYSYQIANSIKFNGTSHALEKTWGSAASDNNKKALSFWIKRSGNGNSAFGSTTNTKMVSANEFNLLQINTGNPSGYSDQFGYDFNNGNNGNWFLAKWRDPSAWMHIIWIWNSDESTAVDRLKFYVNGVNYVVNNSTYFNNKYGNPYPASGEDSTFGKNGMEMHIARYHYNNAEWWGGQMADFIMIDGAASYTDFGEFKNGVWKPVDPSGLTFGDNGFHLDFASSGDLGNDVSGNNNDFSVIGSIPASAQLLDSPTFDSDSNGGNFATYNPLTAGSYISLSEGNLKTTGTHTGDEGCSLATMGVTSGKWYWEVRMISMRYSVPAPGISAGSASATQATTTGGPRNLLYYAGNSSNFLRQFDATIWGSITEVETGLAGFGAGDKMMICLDVDNKKAWFGKNGSWFNSGNPATGANPQFAWTGTGFSINPSIQEYDSSSSSSSCANFGQDGTFAGTVTAQGNSDDTGYGNFYYDPPTGFLALCSGNASVADAVDPAQTDDNYTQKLFTSLAYTGGTTGHVTGFKPDWVWVKARSTGQSHGLFDSTRGTTKILNSDATNAEATSSGLTAFNTNGYDMGTYYNQGANTYASWSWRANGGTTSTNSSGSISVTQQVDPSGGFSISTYSGTAGTPTIGHGLSSAPTFVIVKQTNGTHNWAVYAAGAGATKYGFLESTSGFGTDNMWGNTTPSSTLVYLGAYTQTHGSGRNYVAYCFADTEGYIKSGSYEGNGNVNNAFIYTGFKPAFILIKGIDADGTGWNLHDNATSPFNVASTALQANTASAELSNYNIDMLSNGFKIRDADGDLGTSNNTYIYLAFAKNPSKYATAR